MKHLILTLFATTLALTACTWTAAQKQNASPDASALPAYHWTLTDAQNADGKSIDTLFVRKDHPVQLDFTDTLMMVRNTCNAMSGSYTIEGDQITLMPLRSTMKRCADEKLNQLDREVGQRLSGKISFSLTAAGTTTVLPVLTMNLLSGDRLSFTGTPTPETRYGSKGKIIFLEVASQTRPCSHPLIPEMQCLQAREVYYNENGIKTGNSGDFKNWYQPIEGYTHTPGIRNILRVSQYTVPHPPADASASAYVLDMIVESETIAP